MLFNLLEMDLNNRNIYPSSNPPLLPDEATGKLGEPEQ
jgi:hypothetical protein